ncbi:hypothetical protein [Pseudonocardia acaciae]|uniref:hypothetical protein n=1 Tax=Pseudonocardia acaciae TaxID=551276 RepID=UPI000A93037C|nr:hypothetical protein [Pseudonocardia acaciae]
MCRTSTPRPTNWPGPRGRVADAATRMGRRMPPVDLPALLRESRESSHWDTSPPAS